MNAPLLALRNHLLSSIATQQALLQDTFLQQNFANAVARLTRCYQSGGRIYLAGNGGSAAAAIHLAAEFMGKLARDRAPLPAEALSADPAILTAISNDYGYEQLFSRQLAGKATPNDVFLAITTSGNSPNILSALRWCNEHHISSILLSGHDGGPAAQLAECSLIVRGPSISRIQETQLLLAHCLCECVETAVLG